MNWAQYLIPAISVTIAFAAFYLSTRAARSTAAAGIHAVDAEAYTRASGIYEDTIKNLREDIAALRADLAVAKSEIRDLRQSNERMMAELKRLGRVVNGNGEE